MWKWWKNIALFAALATIIGHNSLPHHHHDAIEPVSHHLEHDEDHHAPGEDQDDEQDTEHHHNLFSFAQLDEDFLPVKVQKVTIHFSVPYLPAPVISYHFNQVKEQPKNHFSYYREFPPPDNFISGLFSRPPPAC
jgi:hypothetical protein